MPVNPTISASPSQTPPPWSGLPVAACLPALRTALAGPGVAVVEAPPGAGKSTGIPLALLGESWLAGRRLVMLEPRRLAARSVAARMASLLGEEVGATIGYRIRLESRVGPDTRIEVVTEGILGRMLQADPALSGVGAVIFDEFHERSLHADLGLALCLEVRSALREDLRLVAMSATLDGEQVAALLGGAPVVRTEGRAFPVETRFLSRPDPRRFAEAAAAAVVGALRDGEDGDVLVFLPGQGEIRRVASLLEGRTDAMVMPLYGDLSQADQDRALGPVADGRRKVVLATAIAETSLTIPGVRVVVDGGRMRVARFDPATAMTRLETLPVSRASADQRRGRAGRLGPGLCYRLWSEAEDRALAPRTPPEILAADLAPLALDLARWGTTDAGDLAWLDPPPAASLAAARALLDGLGAVDEAGRITAHGKAMHDLGLHPRLAHMVLEGARMGLGGLACDIAALLSERDILKGVRDTDLRSRLEILRGGRDDHHIDRGAVARVRAASRDWRRRVGGDREGGSASAGLLLALAYPDRIGKRRAAGPRYALSGGGGAVLDETDPLAASDWLVAASLDGDRREARIFLAAPVTLAEIEGEFARSMVVEESVNWDGREEAVIARRRRRLGRLTLEEKPLSDADSEAVRTAMIAGIRALGLDCLPWSAEASGLRARVAFAARIEPDGGWPDWSDAGLLDGLEDWLAPALDGISRRAHLARLDVAALLTARLGGDRRRLDSLAPTHIAVPSGSRVAVDYGGDVPVLAVRLQEMFGCADTPRVGNGKVPVLLHLLSPARRPLQVTADLAGFWKGAYAAVKADMKGRYPRHPWPDDPLAAAPTARAKPRGR